MKKLDRTRASISATIDDIARIQTEMGQVVSDVGDREAFDILARIERKLKVLRSAKDDPDDTAA
jgi:hypothetical protein